MSPHHIDPNINYKKLRQLSEEFFALWKQLQALYLDAIAGFTLLREHIEQKQSRFSVIAQGTELDSEQFQNKRMFSYTRIFSDDFCTSSIHRATDGEVKSRNSLRGANVTTLGQTCLVSFYTFWNDYLRKEYVKAKGKLHPEEKNNEVKKEALRKYGRHDLWGDIRLLRESIIHNRGVATSDVKRCKLIKWFQPSDDIALTPDHMRILFHALLRYRNELHSEQFPKHYLKVPSKRTD